MDKFAKFTTHRNEDHRDRYWLELTIGGDGHTERSRCIGDMLTRSDLLKRESAAAAALLLAGYAVTA